MDESDSTNSQNTTKRIIKETSDFKKKIIDTSFDSENDDDNDYEKYFQMQKYQCSSVLFVKNNENKVLKEVYSQNSFNDSDTEDYIPQNKKKKLENIFHNILVEFPEFFEECNSRYNNSFYTCKFSDPIDNESSTEDFDSYSSYSGELDEDFEEKIAINIDQVDFKKFYNSNLNKQLSSQEFKQSLMNLDLNKKENLRNYKRRKTENNCPNETNYIKQSKNKFNKNSSLPCYNREDIDNQLTKSIQKTRKIRIFHDTQPKKWCDEELEKLTSLNIYKDIFDNKLNEKENQILEDISSKLEVSFDFLKNALCFYKKGYEQSYIARYLQHVNYQIKNDFFFKFFDIYNQAADLIKLKEVIKLNLKNSNRMTNYAEYILEESENKLLIIYLYYLYFENTEKNVYTNNQLAYEILTNKHKFDSSLYDKIPTKKTNIKLFFLSCVKMISHYISTDNDVISYLLLTTERPDMKLELVKENSKNSLFENVKKLSNKTLKLRYLLPQDALIILQSEKEKLIKITFQHSKIFEKAILKILMKKYLTINIDFLSDCVLYTLTKYFLPKLEYFYRFEMEHRAKELLMQDFTVKLKSYLIKKPAIEQFILALEPQLALYNEFIYFGIKFNNKIVCHDCFDLKYSFKELIRKLYSKYKFQTIILPTGFFSSKFKHLIHEVFFENSPQLNNDIKIIEFKKDSPLIDNMLPYERINYYLNKVQDPLKEFVKNHKKFEFVDCDYYLSIKPYVSKLYNRYFKQYLALVPVDVNIESKEVLEHVTGLNEELAISLVKHRTVNGPFYNRNQLRMVKGFTNNVFEQCAGFLIINSQTISNLDVEKFLTLYNVYDQTIIHPSLYKYADKILTFFDIPKNSIGTISTSNYFMELIRNLDFIEFSERINLNVLQTKVIIEAMLKPLRYDYRYN